MYRTRKLAMSWRFLAATGLLVVFFGSASGLLAQDKPASSTTASEAKSAQSAQSAPVEKKATTSRSAANKSKTTASSRSKSKKSNARSRVRSSATSGGGFGSGSAEPKYELATFGAGCFWHVEADFERLNGVISAVSGYAGGNVRNPNYEMVHEGFTGHAEVVMVQYDPEIINYEDLLKVFWQCHDPTTPNRQGPDVGTQYRSIILYHNEEQKKAALKSYEQLVKARVFRNPIVTQLVPLKSFYRAEDEHQDYYGGKPRAPRRRTTRTTKSRKPMSKVAKALATKPASDPAVETRPGDARDGEAKQAGDLGTAKAAEARP
jgi:peptide-methionine (S)-S-oxide reductase